MSDRLEGACIHRSEKGRSNCSPVQFENHDTECPPGVYRSTGTGNASVSFDGLKEKYRRIAMESREEMMAEIGNLHAEDIQVDYEIRQGKPERVIAETAGKLGIDLIVICTDGRDNIKDFLTGTITEHVINHASCPVLVIPYPKNA
jgi:nucleotide-binding universal stress UspA family protein